MVHEERWVPGAVLAGATHTLPSYAPSIGQIIAARILRGGGFTIDDHAAADVLASIDDHAAADVIAAIDDHAAHGHDITMAAAAGGGGAVTAPVIPGQLESAGGVATMTGAVDALAAAQAHAATAVPVAHAATAVDVAHALTTADPSVAATATKTGTTTFTLSVNTLVGDELLLRYIPTGYLIQS